MTYKLTIEGNGGSSLKTTNRLTSLYLLKQIKNISADSAHKYTEKGYTEDYFTEVKSEVADRAIPHEGFAKTVYKDIINQVITNSNNAIRRAQEIFGEVQFSQGEWVEVQSEFGHKAYDSEIKVTGIEGNFKYEICTEYIRVEIREITNKKDDPKGEDIDLDTEPELMLGDILGAMWDTIKISSEIPTIDKRVLAKLLLVVHPDWSDRRISRECELDGKAVNNCRLEIDNRKAADSK